MGNIFGFIKEIIKPVRDIIDNISTTDEERIELSNQLAEMQFRMQEKVLDYETKLMEYQASVISAEAKGESWLQRSWRPITMLIFVFLVVLKWLGVTPPGITESVELQLMSLIKIGLGGYIIGRSGEKIMGKYKENA